MKLEPLTPGEIMHIREDAEQGRPKFFLATFMISSLHGSEGVDVENQLLVRVAVEGEDSDQPYNRIEDLAAYALPTYLRDLADAIDADLKATEERRAEKAQKETSETSS